MRLCVLVAVLVGSLVLALCAYYAVFVAEEVNYCTMTYMNPRYLPLRTPADAKYRLHLYREAALLPPFTVRSPST